MTLIDKLNHVLFELAFERKTIIKNIKGLRRHILRYLEHNPKIDQKYLKSLVNKFVDSILHNLEFKL